MPSCPTARPCPQGAGGVCILLFLCSSILGAPEAPGITQHEVGTEGATWESLVTPEVAEGLGMLSAEEPPLGAQTTLFSTILGIWGSRD